MRIGITGTRFGFTKLQRLRLTGMVVHQPITEWHHGKCIGVDCESHELIRRVKPGVLIIVHPPLKTEHEGDAEGDETRERKSHFARNRDVVDETDGLIVVPYQSSWQSSGGTWYTHDYARKKAKPVLVIWPDGSLTLR